MPKKPATKNPFTGLWYIISMSTWDDDYLNQEVQALIEFEPNGLGSFQFGYVQGQIDCQTTTRDGNPAVEFTFEAVDGDDGTPETGRGWGILQDDELKGMFFFHLGDDSEFVAKRAAKTKSKRK